MTDVRFSRERTDPASSYLSEQPETQMFDDDTLYLAGDPALLVLGRPSTLAHWRSEGRGPCYVKLGSRVAYRGRDLNEWLGSQTVRPTDGQQPRT